MSPEKRQPYIESPSPSSLAEDLAEASKVHDATDSEDELPEVAELIKRDAATKHAEELKELKQRALAIKYTEHVVKDDEEDDLVISLDPKVAVKEEEHRRAGKQSRPSAARRIVENFAHINPTTRAKKISVLSPNRVRKDFPSIIQDPSLASSAKDINRVMLMKAQDQASQEIKRKEEEWAKHGGRLAKKVLTPVKDFECAMKIIAGKGLETFEVAKTCQMDVDAEDTNKDDEGTPDLRDSASPRSVDDEDKVEDLAMDGDTTMVVDDDDMEEDADFTKVNQFRRKYLVSDSEEENDENALVKHDNMKERQCSTSSDTATEDDHNKENDRELVYEESENKENMNVIPYSPLPETIFHLTNQGGRSLSIEAINRRGETGPNGDSTGQRKPFQLLSEGSPKSQQFSPSTLTQSFASKLQHASPPSGTLAPAPILKPFLASQGLATLGGFSQFSQEPDVFTAPLQPGFTEFYKSGLEQRNSQITYKDRNSVSSSQVNGSPFLYISS